jgi:hypothetical protein
MVEMQVIPCEWIYFGIYSNVVLNMVDCRYENAVKLFLSDGIHIVNCQGNKLSVLHLPESVENIVCDLMDGIEEQDKKGMKMRIIQKR